MNGRNFSTFELKEIISILMQTGLT